MKLSSITAKREMTPLLIAVLLVAAPVLPGSAVAERLSLSGLKAQIDAVDTRLGKCEKGVSGACRTVRNILTVAAEGGDFASIQAAIDSVPMRSVPGAVGLPIPTEVTPTLIRISPGEYFEQVMLRDNIRLQGAGRHQTILRAPPLPVRDCFSRTAILCLQDVTNVEVSELGISGWNQEFTVLVETAINIVQASGIRVIGTYITDVVEGMIGEEVESILLRDNHLPFPANAIELSTSGDAAVQSLVSIIGNQLDSGTLRVTGGGNVHIVGNSIWAGTIMEWEGKLHVSGNQIDGNIEFAALDDSLFNNNTLFGSLRLLGNPEISVVGNSIKGSGFLVHDNGNATIVGNSLNSNSNPISLKPVSDSTVFANHFEVGDATARHNQLVSDNAIGLESRSESVTIKAGNSQIVVDAVGNVTIESDTDITMTSSGKFTVNANGVEINSSTNASIQAGANLNLNAAAKVTAEGSAGAELTSSGITVVKGSLVQIN